MPASRTQNSGAGGRATSPPAPSSDKDKQGDNDAAKSPPADAPLPSESQPFQFACHCLNIEVEGWAPNTLSDRIATGPSAFTKGKTEELWLPAGAETVKRRELATFERTPPASERRSRETSEPPGSQDVWRKCWVCGICVYSTRDRKPSDTAPADVWVQADLADGVLFGTALDQRRQEKHLPFSGLVLDIPTTSTFGRPPAATGPVPYPSTSPSGAAAKQAAVLPPVPDPFFLPPPFVPAHAVLRDMCKAAVATLQERHDDLDRDIREYIAQRAHDMQRIQDQVRAEVEALWDRYSEGPGAGDDTARRRGSGSATRDRSSSPAVARQSFDGARRGVSPARRSSSRTREVPTTDLDSISGVTHSPPKPFSGQHNIHTAQAAASLLSASISANTFHAPPPRQLRAAEDDVAELVKASGKESGLQREQAMSYAFSSMKEQAEAREAALRGPKRTEKKEERVAETLEVQQEDKEKGLDSWINMERAEAVRRDKRETAGLALPKSVAEGEAEVAEKVKKDEANGKETSKERKGRAVKFEEPSPEAKRKSKDSVDEEADTPDDDDTGVFEFDSEMPAEPAILPAANKQAQRNRTMVEDNLSRAFAADAPSHRAAWRKWEARESMAAALRRQEADDDEGGDDDDGPVASNMARSVPVNIVRPMRERGPTQMKTSLTDRGGVVVPNLMVAMRRGSGRVGSGDGSTPGSGEGTEPGSPSPSAAGLRAPRNSIAITGSVARGTGASALGASVQAGGGGRRGSRTISDEREREQVKSYAADPGAVFEALAEAAIDSDESDDEATPAANGRFVPPHVLAQRRDDRPEVGWRSLAG